MKKASTLLMNLALVFAVLVFFTAVPVVAKSPASKASVKQLKKGVSFTAGNLKYKVVTVSAKKKNVQVIGTAKKNVTKIVVPATVKVTSRKGKYKGTFSFKVTSIGAKAFQKNKKIKSVKLGANVISVGKKAFYKNSALKTVALSKSVEKIESYAFAECHSLTKVSVPKGSKLKTIKKYAFHGCSKLKTMPLKNAQNLKTLEKNVLEGTKVKVPKSIKETVEKETTAADYKYEIIPLAAPLNEFFLIKTDNPDPKSFRFVDESSKYTASNNIAAITPLRVEYADVLYENRKTFRVKGGYLASGNGVDGGTLKLQDAKVIGTSPTYNVSTGKTTYDYDFKYKDTKVKVNIASLQDEVDYLINTFGNGGGDFFDKMDAIQSGFSQICLYSGVYVKGTLMKDNSKWGISTSPHADQNFYIQDPYYNADDHMLMFISSLYPFIHDSLGFPGTMELVAKRLNPSAQSQWTETHYLINVTLNGRTETYGGAGSGGGQAIRKSDVRYFFRFDGSSSDAAKDIALSSLRKMICEYGELNIPPDQKEGTITWEDISKTVGEGSYVKVALLNSIFFGVTGKGFSYMYDDGYWMPGYISNAWFDGRYFNKWEYFYPGAAFMETVESEHPSLVFRNFQAKLPDDGRQYKYWYQDLDESRYDSSTGVWKGYTTFYYHPETQTWETDLLTNVSYRSDEDRQYYKIDDPAFIDACTITMDEAISMNLDYNTNKEPSEYYSYDLEEEPGTYHRA